jgi:hypothetical protein
VSRTPSPVSAAEISDLLAPVSGLVTADEIIAAVESAEQTWGCAGFVWFGSDDEPRSTTPRLVIALASASHLPRRHPLAAFGLDPTIAGVLVVQGTDLSTTMIKQSLCSLAAQMRGSCSAIDLHAVRSSAEATAFTLATAPVVAAGFHPVRGVPGRYRFDLTTTIARIETRLVKFATRLEGVRLRPLPATMDASDQSSRG